MKTKSPRVIKVPSSFTVDAYLDFKEECAAIDESMSNVLFSYAKYWTAEQKNSRRQIESGAPNCTHKLPTPLPSRGHAQVNYGAAHQMRRRL